MSVRTVQRLCSEGQLSCFRTPGGQIRVLRSDIDAYRQGLGLAARSGLAVAGAPSSVVQNERDEIETLNLEVKKRLVKRQLKKLNDEDSEDQRERQAAIQAQEQARRAELDSTRLQHERETRQRQQERERAQWAHSWLEAALKSLPQGLPPETMLNVREQVEQLLTKLTPTHPNSVVKLQVEAARDKALIPWIRQCDTEWAIQQGRWQVLGTPSEWQARYDMAAREEIGFIPAASREQKCAVAVQTANQVAGEYKAEQARARAEQEHQRRASMKSFLISLGVGAVGSYVEVFFDEDDLARKTELEQAVRKALEDRLSGAEGVEEAQRIAREVVDAEFES